MKDLVVRFYDKWKFSSNKFDEEFCWEWLGYLDKGGYGAIKVSGVPKQAHRVSWELHRGDIPEGKMVLHKCNNSKCVNPNHLYVGTHRDNMLDAIKAGTFAGLKKGESHSSSVLTTENVKNIRELYITGIFLQSSLAEMYGISKAQLNNIVHYRQWK